MTAKGKAENQRVKAEVEEALGNAAAERRSSGVILPPEGNRAVTIPTHGMRINECPTNLDLATMRGKAMMLKAMSPSDLEVDVMQPVRITATNWVLIPDQSVDEETGEVSQFIRTVFIDANGTIFRTSSAHSPFRLRAMLELFNEKEWAVGIPLVIGVRKSKRGRLYHDFQIDTEDRYGLNEA